MRLLLALALAAPASAQLPAVPPAAAPQARPAAAAADPSSYIESVSGDVQLERRGERGAVSRTPAALEPGDRILTGRRGRAVVRTLDGSSVELAPYAIFTVQSQSADKISLFLESGKLWVSVLKRRLRTFEVRTPVAVAAVRGTQFSVEALEGRPQASIEVFEGSVAVFGRAGDEVLLGARQRVDVLEGRLGRPERFEGRFEDRERRGPKDERREKLKAELRREIGHQLGREAAERNAAQELRNAVYQEGKTLIDAFGKRVRVEEYMTRPDPASFKFVTLNFRDGRLDRGTFEVTANRALPKDLGSVNLWFSPTSSKPDIWAVKQRWSLTNGRDSIVQVALDGDSRSVTFPGQPIFDPGTGTFLAGQAITAHVTVFGNTYEFINEAPGYLHDVWTGAVARPNDSAGMTWHMQPVKVSINNASTNASLATYWDYAFVTRDGAGGSTGKMFIDKSYLPDPFLARFVERRSYIDFVDGNNNSLLDFGEGAVAAGAPGNPFGVAVYHDRVAVLNGAGNEVAYAGSTVGSRDTAGDTTFFTDRNGNGLADEGGLDSYTLPGFSPTPTLLAFSRDRAREWTQSETFIINDAGQVYDFRSLYGGVSSGNDGAGAKQAMDIFERLNFERVVTSSRFGDRKIDIVMTPRMFIRSGNLKTAPNHEGVEGPGN